MLYTYPSNKLENLVIALDHLLQAADHSVLEPDVILVQHPGMQHWLSMALAQMPNRQICMNTEYPLPVRYFWDLIRLILGNERVPQRSDYTREILAWRLYALLDRDDIKHDPIMAEPTAYWQKQSSTLQASRRFQLSEQLADLFEQYLMFRPDWIQTWEKNPAEHWQAHLWQQLVKQNPDHPLALMLEAQKNVGSPAQRLPDNFYIFGINSLAPIWLEFLRSIANQSQTNIHLLYLNPSAEHWDDLRSEKQRLTALVHQNAQSRALWVGTNETDTDSDANELLLESGNPLLSSLGHQGQAFVRLLSEHADYDTHVFSEIDSDNLLHRVQNDILHIRDARTENPQRQIDRSISVTSAHSAFREVQGLHDWLLHLFNDDPDLTPKDVLVMCPNVEDYAPFVQAVFARSFAEIADSVPPLPCSIADRNLKDADPTVAAFLELLTLPDARFEVSQIISWLRVPAIADKFLLRPDDIVQITRWLTHANIHWGLNGEHKQQWLDSPGTDHFTWQQGLDRLLLGFAFSDDACFVNDMALLPDVEGADAILLGRLSNIIEQLQSTRSHLQAERTPAQWQEYLIHQMQVALISNDQSYARSNQHILHAINNLTEFANKAGLSESPLPLSVVRTVLSNAFASPEQTGSQFMTGQITVCSMVPMRSIPFKVIAILGLNDGQYPRSRPPLGFDLMAKDKARLGDRSRRGDDRYLFLEAIMSARQALYLSYQGFDIHKNEKRPPSLVLDEFINYLERAYGYNAGSDVRLMPLQPFSARNYSGEYPSFDANWINLTKATANADEHQLPTAAEHRDQWQLHEWVRFFTNPTQFFAQSRLGLFLNSADDSQLQDSEPFALNHLDRYTLQAHTIELALQQQTDDELLVRKLAASELPLHPLVANQIEDWQAQATEFWQLIRLHGADQTLNQTISADLGNSTLTGSVCFNSAGDTIQWRLAGMKGRDLVQLWLSHLLANSQKPAYSYGFYRSEKDKEKYQQVSLAPIDGAHAHLKTLLRAIEQGLQQPLFANAELALNFVTGKDEEKHYLLAWDDAYYQRGLKYDPYMREFWQQPPPLEQSMTLIGNLYGPLKACCTIAQIDAETHHD